MRAALMHAVGDEQLDLRDDVVTIEPDSTEVKVRIRATGICHSDLSAMAGRLPCGVPMVLGHEAAGEVVATGDHVTSVRPGDHVVICWNPSCGTCPDCLGGQPYLCLKYVIEGLKKPRFRFGPDGDPAFGLSGCGSWAEEIVVPWQAAVAIDRDIPMEYAALLGCGVTTGVGAAITTAEVRPGSSVAVIGCGGVGLSVIQGARLAGAATILAVDPLPAKHSLAMESGAGHTATPDTLADRKAALTGGRGFDYVFEAVGRSATIRTAWDLTRRGGETIVVGAGAADDNVQFNAFELLFSGKRIKSSVYGGTDLRRDIKRYVDLWRSGRLDLDALISSRVGFADLNGAVEALEKGTAIRQIMVFD